MSLRVVTRRRDLFGGLLVFLTTLAVFRACPVYTVFDSRYMMFFSERLLWDRSFSADVRAFTDDLPGKTIPEIFARGVTIPYHLEGVGNRIYYFFPAGSSVLSLPYVAVMNSRGISATHPNGTYSHQGEVRLQEGLAALLMAGLAVIVFYTSRLLVPFGSSLLVAWATAFGTQILSTASRAVWAQTWGAFILALVIWLLLRAETKRTLPQPILLATCLSWLYFVRPTFVTSIVGVAGYLFIRHRSNFIPFALTGAVWLGAFIAWSKYHFGQFVPPYFQSNRLSADFFWEALAGNLISPSRGLFIYVPVLFFVLYLIARYRTSVTMPRLVVLALIIIVTHLAVVSGFSEMWTGGHCYGPRFMTDMVPWFVLLGILALQAKSRWQEANPGRDSVFRRRAEYAVGMLLLGCSITLHAIGSVSPRPWHWVTYPADIGKNPHRAWDWSNPQFIGADGENPTPWAR